MQDFSIWENLPYRLRGDLVLPRFTIREARANEIAVARAFYAKHPDPHVMPRAEDVLRAAQEDGALFCAELAAYPEGASAPQIAYGVGDWIAISGAYRAVYDGVRLFENGGSIVSTPYRGFSVHKLLHAARILTVKIMQAGAYDRIFGAIIAPNNPSKKNLLRAGFAIWSDPPAALRAERDPYATGPGSQIEYFCFPDSALPALARFLLDVKRDGELTRDGRAPVGFDFDLRILKDDILGDVEEIAEGRFDGAPL